MCKTSRNKIICTKCGFVVHPDETTGGPKRRRHTDEKQDGDARDKASDEKTPIREDRHRRRKKKKHKIVRG